MRPFASYLLLALLLPAGLAAQVKAAPPPAGAGWGVPGSPAAQPKLKLFAYAFKHKRAAEALEIVRPLLSPAGTIELRPKDNTLAIHDTAAALTAVEEACRTFDRPPRPLAFEVMILAANRSPYSPPPASDNLPSGLAGRLMKLFPHYSYEVLAATELRTLEGEDVTYEIGAGYGVTFQPGTVTSDRQIKVKGFQVLQSSDGVLKALFNSTITLRIDQQTSFMLAATEDSATRVIVALTPSLIGEPAGRGVH